jgi:hypothetical protein
MKTFQFVLAGCTILLIFLATMAFYLFESRPDLGKYADWVAPTKPVTKRDRLTVRFPGNTNILPSDGETAMLTDGFFTRTLAPTIASGKIAPDVMAADRALKHAGVVRLAGGNLFIYVQHPLVSVLVQASVGLLDGALDGTGADVLFLGIGGISRQTKIYQKAYWNNVVIPISPKLIVPIHFDSLTDPLRN